MMSETRNHMKQILQNLKTGDTELSEPPIPAVRSGHILIRTQSSIISAGTERMLVDFGKANLIDEVQRSPGLFEVLRVLVDRKNNPARFLILGSASRELIRQLAKKKPLRKGFVNRG
jgi:hypothetical protein